MTYSRFKSILGRALGLFVILNAWPAVSDFQSSACAGFEENQIFDQSKKSPNELLQEMYDASKSILALGEANHNNTRSFEYLKFLLETYGLDPKLKFVILEKGADWTQGLLFSRLSTQAMDEQAMMDLTPYSNTVRKILKGEAMAADPYFMSQIVPLIQELNQNRPLDRPLTIVPIDGYSNAYAETNSQKEWSQEALALYNEDQIVYAKGRSWNRENYSLLNFEDVMSAVAPSEKVVVLYHAFHLVQGVEARLPQASAVTKQWEAPDWQPMTWFGRYLKKHPEMKERSKIVLFDEKDASSFGNWAPDGMFKMIQRQAKRYPNEAFAICSKPFEGLLPERGLDLLEPTVEILHWYDKIIRSEADISEIADGIIWSPDAHIKSRGAFY